MADIQLTCTTCGRIQTVTALDTNLAMPCPTCGRVMSRLERKPGLTLRRRDAPCPHVAEAGVDVSLSGEGVPGLPDLAARRAARIACDHHSIRAYALRVWLNILVFLALVVFLAYCRFGVGWAEIPLEDLKLYGRLSIAAAYLFVIGLALRDNMFDGLLAIVVPLYPFYYLFFTSSALFTRALVGALLVVFGYDALLYLQGLVVGGIGTVKFWFQHP